MNSHTNRIHPVSYFGMCLLTVPVIVMLSYFIYLDIRLDFSYTKEISANVVNWEIMYSKYKDVTYVTHYEFKIMENNPVVITGSGSLAYEAFENSKLYPHIQVKYVVSNPDINRPIRKNESSSKYIGPVLAILICLPLACFGLGGLFIIPFTSKERINPNKVINSMHPYD